MVPVKKPIIAGKAPEASAPQKRRPRNTELNSSKKVGGFAAAVQKRYQSLNSSKSYDGYPYEEVSLEELAKQSRVSVPELNDIIKAFEDEKGCKVMKVLMSTERGGADGGDDWDGKSIIIQTDCGDFYWGTEDFVPVNSSEEPDSVNPSEKDAQSLNSEGSDSGNGWRREDGTYYAEFSEAAIGDAMVNAVRYIDNRTDWDHMKSGTPAEDDEEYAFRYDQAEVVVDDDSLPTIVVGPRNSDSIKKLQNGDFSNALCYVEVSSKSGDMNTCYALGKDVIGAAKQMMVDPYSLMYKTYTGGAEGDVDSSKKQDMNCSEGESGTIYTESGNEVAITDIKVVQNPETNALALFVPENGDDEIPEGFTVIGDVIATASGAPAIEENAETGDDSLNSSKKPPMNRAQRRAAQRGARRPKKR